VTRRRGRWTLPGMGAAALAGIVVIVTLFPIYNMLLTSLKPDPLLLVQPPRFWFPPTLANYGQLMRTGFARYYLNSITVAVWGTAVAVVVGAMVAFAFARMPFRGKRWWLLFAVLIPNGFPPIATIIPIYFAVRALGLIDRVSTLTAFEVAVRLPFVIWVMRGFFRTVPGELIDAAEVDGCGLVGAFFRIVMPLAAPGLVAVAILSFIDIWNSFIAALVLTSFNAVTAPVSILSFMEMEEQLNWGIVAAAGCLTILPVLVFALVVRRYVLAGFAVGTLK